LHLGIGYGQQDRRFSAVGGDLGKSVVADITHDDNGGGSLLVCPGERSLAGIGTNHRGGVEDNERVSTPQARVPHPDVEVDQGGIDWIQSHAQQRTQLSRSGEPMCRKRVPCCKPNPVPLRNGQAPKLPCDINVPPDKYHRTRKNAAFMPGEQVRANSQQKRGPVLTARQLNDSRATKRPISEDPPRQAQH
jgi:hypothetical protein